MTSDACPYGWVQNATGDCVNLSEEDGDSGNGQVLDPCPEGWVLGMSGFCVLLGDEDIPTEEDGDLDASDVDDELEQETSDTVVDGDTTPVHRKCNIDQDCNQAELCQFIDDQGEGICFSKCIMTGNCREVEGASYCSKEQRCVLGQIPENCTSDAVCEYGNVCHSSANCGEGKCFPECRQDNHCSLLFEGVSCSGSSDGDEEATVIESYYCSGEYRCEPGIPGVNACVNDGECPVDQVCHNELNDFKGKCLETCRNDTFCQNYQEAFICNTVGKCIEDRSDNCQQDIDCPYGQVCHAAISLCNPKCSNDSHCNVYSETLWCNSLGYCAESPTIDGCTDNWGCHFGNVCHYEVPNANAPSRGTCLPYCTDADDCIDRIGTPYWYCNALNECSPSEIPDGDLDEEIEIEVVDPCDSDVLCAAQHRRCFNNGGVAECGSCLSGYYEDQGLCIEGQSCVPIMTNSIYTINIETANFRAIAKKDGAIYSDPSSLSAIYLRDNESGNLFQIYSNFSDGGSLEQVEVIKGSYNVWVQNNLGQRKEVLTNVEIDNDLEMDVPFDFNKITINLNKNSQPFPQLSVQNRGQLKLYDAYSRRMHLIGEIGGDSNSYTINVFDSSYSIIFDGYLNDDGNSYQLDTLISKDPVTSDRTYNINLDTVTISGAIDVDGNLDGGEDNDFGEAWLINVTTNDRFVFWSIDTTDEISFSREVLRDFYYVCYKPQHITDKSYLWRPENFRQWDEDTSGQEIDFELINFTGHVSHNSESLFELRDVETDELLDRGDIYLRDSQTKEKFHLLSLGKEGNGEFDVWIGPGTYDYYYQGRLIEDEYYQGNVYPSAVQNMVWQTDVELDQDTITVIDLPLVSLTGSVSVSFAGQPADFSEATGDIVSVRRANTSSDIPIFRFHKLPDSHVYSVLMFPGTYDMRYSGSSVLGLYQNNKIFDSFIVSQNENTKNINIETSTLGVTIISGDNNLYDLLQNGTYESADIRVSNDITRLLGADEVDENGRFVIERPVGDISLLLYLYKGDSYQIYPLISASDWEFTGDDELSFDISPVTFVVNVLKNGEVLPDASQPYSRGNLFLKSDDSWETDIRLDLGKEGDSYDIHSVVPGRYGVNLSVGYGKAFPFLQWKYIECAEISK